jgi:tetratricopeptide (TPR) repeat protein
MADISGEENKSDFVQIEEGQNIIDYSQFLISKVTRWRFIRKILRNKSFPLSYDEQDQPSDLRNFINSVRDTIWLQLQENRRDDERVKLICLLSCLHMHRIPDFLSSPASEFRDHQLNTVELDDKLLCRLLANPLIGRSNDSRSTWIVPAMQAATRFILEEKNEIFHFLAAGVAPTYWTDRVVKLVNVAHSKYFSGILTDSGAAPSNMFCFVDFSRVVSASLNWSLASDLFSRGAYDESFQMFEEALRLEATIPGTDWLGTARMLLELGITFGKHQRYDQGLRFLERSLNMTKAAMGVDHSNVANTLACLGLMYFAMGKYNDAISHYNSARIIKEKHVGSDHPNLTETYGLLGEAYFKLGFFDISSEWCRRALEISKNTELEFHPKRIDIMASLAKSYTYIGRYDSALEIYKNVLDTFASSDCIEWADVVHNMGVALQGKCKFDEAIAAFKNALQVYRRKSVSPYEKVKIAMAIQNIGVVYSEQGRHNKAIEYLRRALRLEKSLGESETGIAKTMNNLGAIYACLGDPKKAMSRYRIAFDIVRRTPEYEYHVDVADLLYNMGMANSSLGRIPPAKTYLKQSLRIFVAQLGDQHQKSLRAKKWLRRVTKLQRMTTQTAGKRSYRHSRGSYLMSR